MPARSARAFAIPESRLPDACRDLTAYPGIEEGMIISTCNRVEVITHTTNGSADLRGFLHEHFHLTAEDLDPHLYEFRENESRAPCLPRGLQPRFDGGRRSPDSRPGQRGYATARAVGAVRGQLDQLFTRAFAVAKRVRSETP